MENTKLDIVLVDIDGCLVSYPAVFLQWVEKTTGIKHEDIEDMKASMTKDEYEEIKQSYRNSGVKRILPIRPGARKTLKLFKKHKWIIWIATKRPNIAPVNRDTRYWLDNHIPYDLLLFMDDKRKLFDGSNNIKMVIDDDATLLDWVSVNRKHIRTSNGNWNEIRKQLLEINQVGCRNE